MYGAILMLSVAKLAIIEPEFMVIRLSPTVSLFVKVSVGLMLGFL
jgi:hypothetical protein